MYIYTSMYMLGCEAKRARCRCDSAVEYTHRALFLCTCEYGSGYICISIYLSVCLSIVYLSIYIYKERAAGAPWLYKIYTGLCFFVSVLVPPLYMHRL